MKQNVSAPVAAIVLALVVLASVVVFSRPKAGATAEEQPFVLPFAPPVDENQQRALYEGLAPLGIACVMTPLAADRFKGARVALVAPGSPAEKGGIRAGDLVVRFGETKVTSPFSILAALAKVDPSKPSAVAVVRAGKEQKLVITGLRPPPPEERI